MHSVHEQVGIHLSHNLCADGCLAFQYKDSSRQEYSSLLAVMSERELQLWAFCSCVGFVQASQRCCLIQDLRKYLSHGVCAHSQSAAHTRTSRHRQYPGPYIPLHNTDVSSPAKGGFVPT